MLLHYLPKWGNTKIAFVHSNARIQPDAAWFLQSFWLMSHTHAAVWLPKSCSQCVQLGAVGGMVQEKGSWQHSSSWTVLHAQCNSALPSGLPLLQGNAEALDRWGGKTKHHLISYFSAKNYRNQIVYVKWKTRRDVFLRHSVVGFLSWTWPAWSNLKKECQLIKNPSACMRCRCNTVTFGC